MSIQREFDAVTEAWTMRSWMLLKLPMKTRDWEVARILCPAGFEIVQAQPASGQRH
jgi:hypothetical protein